MIPFLSRSNASSASPTRSPISSPTPRSPRRYTRPRAISTSSAKFYVDPSTDIGHFIAEKVQPIPGIAHTRTIITFKAFGAGTQRIWRLRTAARPTRQRTWFQSRFFGGGVGPCTGGSVKM